MVFNTYLNNKFIGEVSAPNWSKAMEFLIDQFGEDKRNVLSAVLAK